LQCLGYRKPRAIGVNVNFNEFKVTYTDNAVAYRVEIFSQSVDIGGRGFLFKVDNEKFYQDNEKKILTAQIRQLDKEIERRKQTEEK